MTRFILIGTLAIAISGCGSKPGSGLWHLKVGGEAKLISADGSEITLERFAAPAGKPGLRAAKTTQAEEIKLPAGTVVVVHAIDGDDARVEIKEGPRAKSVFWVECAKLEALAEK